MRGYIKYVSREPVNQKPAHFATGGYSVRNTNGDLIAFDWSEMVGASTVLEDGRVEIEARLRDFDIELYDSSNSGVKDILTIPLSRLASMELVEAYNECYKDQDDEETVLLDVVEFLLFDQDANKEYHFSKENIEKFNIKQAIEDKEGEM